MDKSVKKISKYFFISICVIISSFTAKAQMVGTDAFIQGTSVEIGIDGAGGFEGSSAVPPPTMHPRGGFGLFGFVANPQINAWATFFGDYFTPGSPENGWGLQVGNTSMSPMFSNNSSGDLDINSGSTLAYSHVLNCYNIDWSGSVISGTTNINAKINYFLGQNDLFYTTTVTLKNNSASVIPNLYYYRNVDPDNNQAVSGNFDTDNLIEDQPGFGPCNLACVSASQTDPSFTGTAYLAFAGVGPDFRVSYGGFSERSGYDIWNGLLSMWGSPFTQAVGSTVLADEAIQISYRIQNFLPGTTRTFKFVTILNAGDKIAAVNNLLSLSYPGSAYVAPSACSPANPPDTARICGPTKIEITGSNVNDYAWSWNPTSFLSIATTFSAIVSPTVQTTYTITGIPITPCASTVPLTYTVVVIPAPLIPVVVSPSITVCTGSSIYLTSTPGGAGAIYSWSGPGGFASAAQNPTIAVSSPTNTGTYTVSITVASGCTSTEITTVSFIPTNTISIAPGYTICQGGVLNLAANAIGATGYSWAGPSAFVSSVQNPTITGIAPIQAGNYTVTAYFVVGTATCSTTNTTKVTVVPATPAALAPIPTICNNASINLVSPAGGTSYSWNGPNAFSSALQNPTIANASVVNIGTYTVTITTGLCINTGTVNITVFNTLSFSGLPTNATLCYDKNGILSASGIGGSGSYNYVWSPTTGLATPNSGTTTVTGLTSTVYTVTLSDANCPMTVSPITTANVIVNPTPVITMTTSNSRGCEVFCTDLISSSVPASANCQWRFTNGLASNACNTSNFCFPTHGTYGATLTVTDINGCVDSLKNNAFVVVDPNPNADFGWTPDNPTILINEIAFHDQSTIGLPITAWFWDFGDVFVNDSKDFANIPNPSHTYENAYTYSVNLIVINKFGCRDSVMKILKIEDEFSLFIPNSFTPGKADGNNDVFKVAGMGFIAESFEMRIYDRWGELVFKTNDVNKGWDGSVKGGKIAKPDTYVYKIKIKDFKNKTREVVGHLTIIE